VDLSIPVRILLSITFFTLTFQYEFIHDDMKEQWKRAISSVDLGIRIRQKMQRERVSSSIGEKKLCFRRQQGVGFYPSPLPYD